MAVDAKKHISPAAGEKPTRAGLAAMILSANDIIPVANATEAAQVVQAIAALGQNVTTSPVVVARADARGAHRIEVTYDPAGLVWMPVSALFSFASKAAADTFGSANGALLTVGDRCDIAGVRYRWSGSGWFGLSARMKRSATAKSITNSTINQTLSTTTFWTEDWRDAGIAAYNDGWTIPFSGEWEIDFGGVFSGATDLYVSVNKTSLATFADFFAFAQGPLGAAGVGMPQGVKRMRFAANDVIRIFGASVPASVSWDTTASASWFGIKFVGD